MTYLFLHADRLSKSRPQCSGLHYGSVHSQEQQKQVKSLVLQPVPTRAAKANADLGVGFEGSLDNSYFVTIALLLCCFPGLLLCHAHKAHLDTLPNHVPLSCQSSR